MINNNINQLKICEVKFEKNTGHTQLSCQAVLCIYLICMPEKIMIGIITLSYYTSTKMISNVDDYVISFKIKLTYKYLTDISCW